MCFLQIGTVKHQVINGVFVCSIIAHSFNRGEYGKYTLYCSSAANSIKAKHTQFKSIINFSNPRMLSFVPSHTYNEMKRRRKSLWMLIWMTIL